MSDHTTHDPRGAMLHATLPEGLALFSRDDSEPYARTLVLIVALLIAVAVLSLWA